MNWLFEQFIKLIEFFFMSEPIVPIFPPSMEPSTPSPTPPTPPVPPTPVVSTSKYVWTPPGSAKHSARMIMDEYGLSLKDKDTLTACIMQESEFNPKAIGKPNKNGTRDYGLCQYNNGTIKGIPLWIGKGAAFANTEEVLNDPEKNVRIMVKTFLAGHLNWWSSFSTGAYKKWL